MNNLINQGYHKKGYQKERREKKKKKCYRYASAVCVHGPKQCLSFARMKNLGSLEQKAPSEDRTHDPWFTRPVL